MKHVFLFMVAILMFVTPLFAKFAVPASPRGAFADVLTGTKLLRESGITLHESSANIVELRLKLMKTDNGTRVSFLTLQGDTFFFDETSIWLERKGQALALYMIETKQGDYEVDPATLVFRPTTPRLYSINTTNNTSTKKTVSKTKSSLVIATTSTTPSAQQAVVVNEPAKLIDFGATQQPSYTSATDSILAIPRPNDTKGLTFQEFMIIMGEIHPDTQFTAKEVEEIQRIFEGDTGPPPRHKPSNTWDPETVP